MAELPYETICVTGDDAFDFLQGQLTIDLARPDLPNRTLSAWCNPKGRVICLFRVRRIDGGYSLSLPAELAETVLKRLTIFRFRARVDFETRPALSDELGIDGDYESWALANLENGIPEIYTEQSEEHTAHMLNLDLLDAVSVEKGCYTGQEIIARTHYRGATKRRLHRFTADATVAPGDKVMLGDRPVGEVVNVIGNELLAVVPIDKAGETLTVGETSLTLAPLGYLSGNPD